MITVWFIVFEVLCAMAVVNIANGQPSVTAYRHEYKKTAGMTIKHPGVPLYRFTQLEIVGKQKVSVTIIKGENRALVLDTAQFKSVKWWFDNERLVVFLEGKEGNRSSQAKIILPGLERLSCYYLEDLYLDGLEQGRLEVMTSDVRYLNFRENNIESMSLMSRAGGRDKNISLGASNIFDTLSLRVRGAGSLDIGCDPGQFSSTALSDSLKVTAETKVLKKIMRH
jgi:hypothetical protein